MKYILHITDKGSFNVFQPETEEDMKLIKSCNMAPYDLPKHKWIKIDEHIEIANK